MKFDSSFLRHMKSGRLQFYPSSSSYLSSSLKILSKFQVICALSSTVCKGEILTIHSDDGNESSHRR